MLVNNGWADLTKFYIKKDLQKIENENNIKYFLIDYIYKNPNYIPLILEIIEMKPELRSLIERVSVLA